MNTQSTAKPQPTHRIYSVTGAGKKPKWIEVGAAWPNKDGKGFSITYGAIPLTGRIVMRQAKRKEIAAA